jgi:hypothetical protein
MARSYQFTCDGCGLSTTTSDDELPKSWGEVSVRITGLTNWVSGGGEDRSFHPLLCPTCQIILTDKANPKIWTRQDKAGK